MATKKKRSKTIRKTRSAKRARRAPRARPSHNPQRQLAKTSAESSAPSTTRAVSRGLQGPTMPEGFFGAYTGAALSEQDYADAARALGCDVAAKPLLCPPS